MVEMRADGAHHGGRRHNFYMHGHTAAPKGLRIAYVVLPVRLIRCHHRLQGQARADQLSCLASAQLLIDGAVMRGAPTFSED